MDAAAVAAPSTDRFSSLSQTLVLLCRATAEPLSCCAAERHTGNMLAPCRFSAYSSLQDNTWMPLL